MTATPHRGSLATRTPPSGLPERMDDPHCDPHDLEEALDILGRTARRFGGDRLLLRGIRGVLGSAEPGPISILDVGAGGGDSAASLRTALSDLAWTPCFVLADRHAATLRLAARRVEERDPDGAYGFVRLDGEALPFRDGAFDLVVCSTVLHHLEDAAAGALLREAARVSTRGWVVADLRRSRWTLAAVRLLAGTLWRRSALPRVDGPVSVRRSFTTREVRGLLAAEGLNDAIVEGRLLRWTAQSA